jgi:hypothetical protein
MDEQSLTRGLEIKRVVGIERDLDLESEMQFAVEEPTMNGVVAMPVKKVTISLDEIGYTGWKCVLRTNPRAEYWDRFLSDNDPEAVWINFATFILDWNFGDEEGNKLPLPPETKRIDLPAEIPNFLVNHYIDAFNEAAGFPKLPNDNSGISLQTRSESQPSDGAPNADT